MNRTYAFPKTGRSVQLLSHPNGRALERRGGNLPARSEGLVSRSPTCIGAFGASEIVVLTAFAGSSLRFLIEMPFGPLHERHRVSSKEAMLHPFFGESPSSRQPASLGDASRRWGHRALLRAVDQEVEVAPLVGLQHVVEVEPLIAATSCRSAWAGLRWPGEQALGPRPTGRVGRSWRRARSRRRHGRVRWDHRPLPQG